MSVIMNLGGTIKALRKEKGVTQESLAEFFGISVQAVSKWECGLSYPDIELLPIIASFFDVSIDFLFNNSTNKRTDVINLDIPNDDNIRIIQFHGNKMLTKDTYNEKNRIMLNLPFDDYRGKVEIWGSADIDGNVSGGLSVGGSIECGNISGGVNCGGYIESGNISGGVNAGGYIESGDISGGVNAGAGINCGNVAGGASCCGEINCDNISGQVPSDGNISCGDIDGNILLCKGDIHCETIKGDVKCEGSIHFDQ